MKDLSLHILDIVQNSISAEAKEVEIHVQEDERSNKMVIRVVDDGRGMSREVAQKALDPYHTSRTTRKVGMGLPLFRHTAEQAGGQLTICSEPGKGAMVEATMPYDHIDRPELGDMAGVISLLIGSNPQLRFRYHHQKNKNEYQLDTRDVNEALEGTPINDPGILRYIREMIRENIGELG